MIFPEINSQEFHSSKKTFKKKLDQTLDYIVKIHI